MQVQVRFSKIVIKSLSKLTSNKNEWEFIPRSRVGDLRIGMFFRIGVLVALRELVVLGELVVFRENWLHKKLLENYIVRSFKELV